ncbi:MAG: site-specific DNA-methyltransferase [Planctomycetes bacterium]|nr:site-specific DNA-methyltransferase [Planctomycetota bacterium]NOG55457.1 site-specific DNA-methyltransferase [Planctomycetota bacterium]
MTTPPAHPATSTLPNAGPPLELVWPGKYHPETHLRRQPITLQGTATDPHPHRHHHHAPPITPSTLAHGRFQHVLTAAIPENTADFIYADPPFATDRLHRTTTSTTTTDDTAYSDRWTLPDYLDFLDDLIALSYSRLAPDGILAVHVDHRASPYVRSLMQEHFGVVPGWGATHKQHSSPPVAAGGVFINELIWRYGLGNSRGGKYFLRKHDTIAVFAKSKDYYFDPPVGPASDAQKAKYCHIEDTGDGTQPPRRYMVSYGKKYYFKGGKRLDSILEIPSISPTARERTGYPTQKPLALLELLIRTFCKPGGLVIDPVAGCGTTAIAAARLDRPWIAIDQSPTAVDFARKRLVEHIGADHFDDVDYTSTPIVK